MYASSLTLYSIKVNVQFVQNNRDTEQLPQLFNRIFDTHTLKRSNGIKMYTFLLQEMKHSLQFNDGIFKLHVHVQEAENSLPELLSSKCFRSPAIAKI